MTTLRFDDSEPGSERSVRDAMLRGLRQRCPACGKGRIFGKYLKVADHCNHCGEALHHQRADDAPAYFTIVIIGHIIVPLALVLERQFSPALWVHMALWLPLSIITALWSLPRIKGALVGLQWALKMHGFGAPDDGTGHLPQPQPETHG